MTFTLLTPLLALALLTSCSSTEEKKETSPSTTSTNNEPKVVMCQGEPSNCEYEIQKDCQDYELIGKPVPSFFSSSVAYRVRYKCNSSEGSSSF